MAIEIVDFPIKNGYFPLLCKRSPQDRWASFIGLLPGPQDFHVTTGASHPGEVGEVGDQRHVERRKKRWLVEPWGKAEVAINNKHIDIWVWVNTYRYIHFSGMNIHLPAILGFTRYQGFDPSPYIDQQEDWWLDRVYISKFIMWIICDNTMIYWEMIIMSQEHVRTCDDNEDIMGISWYINILYQDISSTNTPTITGSDRHPRFPGRAFILDLFLVLFLSGAHRTRALQKREFCKPRKPLSSRHGQRIYDIPADAHNPNCDQNCTGTTKGVPRYLKKKLSKKLRKQAFQTDSFAKPCWWKMSKDHRWSSDSSGMMRLPWWLSGFFSSISARMKSLARGLWCDKSTWDMPGRNHKLGRLGFSLIFKEFKYIPIAK